MRLHVFNLVFYEIANVRLRFHSPPKAWFHKARTPGIFQLDVYATTTGANGLRSTFAI